MPPPPPRLGVRPNEWGTFLRSCKQETVFHPVQLSCRSQVYKMVCACVCRNGFCIICIRRFTTIAITIIIVIIVYSYLYYSIHGSSDQGTWCGGGRGGDCDRYMWQRRELPTSYLKKKKKHRRSIVDAKPVFVPDDTCTPPTFRILHTHSCLSYTHSHTRQQNVN